MPTSSQTNDKIEVELFSLRKAVERDAEAITTELVSLVFFCKIAVVICCILLGISVLKKLFLGSDSICGMMNRSKTPSNSAREMEEQRKLAL